MRDKLGSHEIVTCEKVRRLRENSSKKSQAEEIV